MELCDVQVVCSHLSEADLGGYQLLEQLHDAVNVYYNFTGTASCFDINQTAVTSLQVTGWDFQVPIGTVFTLGNILVSVHSTYL